MGSDFDSGFGDISTPRLPIGVRSKRLLHWCMTFQDESRKRPATSRMCGIHQNTVIANDASRLLPWKGKFFGRQRKQEFRLRTNGKTRCDVPDQNLVMPGTHVNPT